MRTEMQTTGQTVTLDDLRDSGRYELLRELSFNDLMPFVTEYYWKRRTALTLGHVSLTLLLLGLWFVAGLSGDGDLDSWFTCWGGAFLLFLALLPVHEALHGLVYRLCGATDVRYGILWRQAAAYATAHHFVADARQFAWVAVTPFLVINGVLLLTSAVLPDLRPLLLGALFWHTTGTAGDFALLNYFRLHRDRQVYTCDDAETKTSYFYAAR